MFKTVSLLSRDSRDEARSSLAITWNVRRTRRRQFQSHQISVPACSRPLILRRSTNVNRSSPMADQGHGYVCTTESYTRSMSFWTRSSVWKMTETGRCRGNRVDGMLAPAAARKRDRMFLKVVNLSYCLTAAVMILLISNVKMNQVPMCYNV